MFKSKYYYLFYQYYKKNLKLKNNIANFLYTKENLNNLY